MFTLRRTGKWGVILFAIAIIGLSGIISDARNGRDETLRKAVEELRQLIEEKQSQGVDVSEARTLFQESQRAMEAGKKRKTLALLNQGIALLKEKTKEGPAEPQIPLAQISNVIDGKFIYGLRIDPPHERDFKDIEKYFALAHDLGMGFVKMGIIWDYIEPQDDVWTWKGSATISKPKAGGRKRGGARGRRGRESQGSRENAEVYFDYDSIATLSQQYNISVIPMFLRSKQGERERDPVEYAEYIYTFIKRYHQSMNIRFIEFQNEPNADNDGSGGGKNWPGTAADLAKVGSAAYEKVKSEFPNIMIGTAGFITGSRKMIEMYTKKFYEAYFLSRPKFDVFLFHDYPKNMSYMQGSGVGDLASQYYNFDSYRNLLNRYSYHDKPILVTEGNEEKPGLSDGEAATQYVASFIMAKINAGKNRVLGKFISNGIMSSKPIALINVKTGQRTKQFEVVRQVITFLSEYPLHSQHIAGEINSEYYWVEEFKNKKGEKLWVAFCPLLYETKDGLRPKDLEIVKKVQKYPQTVTLNVSSIQSVKIATILDGQVQTITAENGKITFTLGESPMLVEEKSL